MAQFHITPGVASLSLPPSREGQISFAVTNNVGRAVRIRASIPQDDKGEARWLSVSGEAERDLAPTETETFLVQIQVPRNVPEGDHRFRLLVASVERPDDEYDTSPEVAFKVPQAQPPPPFPWWIVATAGAALLLGGGFLVGHAVRQPAESSVGPAGPQGPPGTFSGTFDGPVTFNGDAKVAGNLSVTGSISGTIPPGAMMPFAGSTAPSGWFLCNGAEVSRTQYLALFQVITIAYGGGDGVTTFNLPDLRGRVVLGAGTGPGLSARAVGQKLGEEAHTLTVAEMPSHSHSGQTGGVNVGASSDPRALDYSGTGTDRGLATTAYIYSGGAFYNNHQHSVTTVAVGGGAAHNTIPPAVVLNYIIKY